MTSKHETVMLKRRSNIESSDVSRYLFQSTLLREYAHSFLHSFMWFLFFSYIFRISAHEDAAKGGYTEEAE